MCGIAAIIGDPDPHAVLAAWRMLRAQAHRGPDGVGIARPDPDATWRVALAGHVAEIDPPVEGAPRAVLAHNWLAVQDQRPDSAQPMTDGPLALTFNGEIYNFVELREELEAAGERFHTGSDTEVLLALWRREGPACLARLRGMFAFVIHDAASGRTWAVRDRFGIKPLYIAHASGRALLASEIRAIHATGLVERTLRDEAVLAAAAGGVNTFGERATLYAGVEEVPPGTLLTIEPDGATSEQTFATLPPLTSDLDRDEAVEALRAELERSVEVHLRSGRRLATCLSGGLDSTNLAWIIGRRLGRPDFDVFTVLTDERLTDEADRAAAVADAGGLRHHLRTFTGHIELCDVIDTIVACESPNHVIGPINQHLLLREIAGHGASVVLDGQGGDELLSGYPWYTPLLLDAVRARGGDADALAARCAERPPLRPDALDRLVRAFSGPGAWVREIIGGDSFLGIDADRIAELDETRWYMGEGHDWASFRERTYRRGELAVLLRQEDRLGMWHGLECRVPFVDGPLVEVAARIPPEALLRDGYLKHPLRVLYPELPEDVRFSVAKRGFWDTRLKRFDWLGPVSHRLVMRSDTLRRLFPRLKDHWRHVGARDRMRVMQIAVLEQAGTRHDAAALTSDLTRWLERHRARRAAVV